MSNIVSNNYTPFQVFPKYVVDETLQKVVTSNENGDPALRVVCNDVEPDLTEIESRIGAKTEGQWNNAVDTNPGSIISILKNIDNKLTTPIPLPPQPKVLQTIINLGNGQPVPFTDFQTFDPNNPSVTLTNGYQNILGIHHNTIVNKNEIVLYIQPTNYTETVDLTTLFMYNPSDGETKFYVGHSVNNNGFVFEFTDGTDLEFNTSTAQSRYFRKSLDMFMSDDLIDFSPLFA